jgi:hypothetical protein
MGFIIRNRLAGTEIRQPGHEVAEDAPVIEQQDERPAKLLTLTDDVAEYELHPLDQSIVSGVAQSYHNGADGTVLNRDLHQIACLAHFYLPRIYGTSMV